RVEGPTARARECIVAHHPLQPFDERNFIPGRLAPARPWSFDAVTLEGARALAGERRGSTPFLASSLPPARSDIVELDRLIRFVQHPVRAFLRQRLGISVGDWSEEIHDALPVELDGLEQWGVGQRILDARLAGAHADACIAAERARGLLPPGALAQPVVDEIRARVDCIVSAALALVEDGSEPDVVEVSIPLADGRLLVGTVSGVVANLVLGVTYSRVAPKHRLPAWVNFLALTAARPEAGLEVVTVGRRRAGGRGKCNVTVARLAPFGGDASLRRHLAMGHLQDLVALYDRGMCEPLPIYCATSAAYASALQRGRDAAADARKAWQSDRFDGEDRDLEHELVLDGVRSFDDLLEPPPCDDEEGEGWEASEVTRFGRYARRLWDGLLAAETVVDQ
nr:exodeoxyribonuclease V subunit gamma [Actinomycetota bacterium]